MSLIDPITRPQWVFSFQEGAGLGRDLLGGKGAELSEMMSLGLPVPPGFTITTEACREYYSLDEGHPLGLYSQVHSAMAELEATTGRRFGLPSNPLLVSVRSGAAISMPGMMDTVLNLGINAEIANGIAATTGNRRFALDLHRRFIQMFANVVLGIDGGLFDEITEEQQRKRGVDRIADLTTEDLEETIARFSALVEETTGGPVPDEPHTQLEQAIGAVFDSWNSSRAIAYRAHQGIPDDLGTAVNVVSMVYGNMDDNSGTGVLFTRSPSNGEKALYGEYLINAQGEDVVSGAATPQDISHLAEEMPRLYEELDETAGTLERHYGDVQDVEFTIQQGRLDILQTRNAKRSAAAAVKTAVDMAQEGLITRDEALLRVDPEQIYQLLLPRFEDEMREAAKSAGRLLASGLGASPGAATGKVVFDADNAAELGEKGVSVILVRPETSPDDVHGMLASAGILTARGGATSHAAVVARGLGKPCVTGAESLEVNPDDGYLRCEDITVREGSEISIDGASGEVFGGSMPTVRPAVTEEEEMQTLLAWADQRRRLGVWANADTPRDAIVARDFGAEGIGLCRTEHMFFGRGGFRSCGT